MRYAQIDENGICFADSYLSGEVYANNMIPLNENAVSPLGKKYNDGRASTVTTTRKWYRNHYAKHYGIRIARLRGTRAKRIACTANDWFRISDVRKE